MEKEEEEEQEEDEEVEEEEQQQQQEEEDMLITVVPLHWGFQSSTNKHIPPQKKNKKNKIKKK